MERTERTSVLRTTGRFLWTGIRFIWIAVQLALLLFFGWFGFKSFEYIFRWEVIPDIREGKGPTGAAIPLLVFGSMVVVIMIWAALQMRKANRESREKKQAISSEQS